MDPVRLGKYEIVREVARGSMGLVFQARDTVLNRTVALKVLKEGDADDKFVKRLHIEAQAAARLRHPNIISIHDVGVEGPVHYFAMDYIEGTSLDRILETTPLPRLLEILREVALAVDFAHRQGIIHRDLKPANILLDAAGRPVVTDFGLAKTHDAATHITKTGAAIGTPHYMAPEQVLGQYDQMDPRTDVFALGVILYQMLTRKLPHGGTTTLEVFRAIINDDVEPPQTNPDLRTVCMKAMEKEKTHRYPSAAAFADDLDRHLRGEPVAARPPSTMRRVRAGVSRHPALMAALAAGVAALAIGGAFGWREMLKRRQEQQRVARLEAGQKERERRAREAAPFFDEGKRFYEKARTLYDTLQGNRLVILELLGDAARKLEGAAAIHESAEAHDYLGRTFALRYRLDGDRDAFSRAETHFRKAVELMSTLTTAYLEWGRLCFHRYMEERGAPAILIDSEGRSLIGPLPPETDALQPLLKAAREYLSRAAPEWAEGAVAFADGKHEIAIRRFSGALEKEPSNAESWYYRGMARYFVGDLVSAERDLSQAIQWLPRYFLAYVNRGLIRASRRRFGEAILDYNAAIGINPDHRDTYINRGLCYIALGEYERAERDCDRVLQADPKNIICLLNRGRVRQLRNNAAGAESDWQELVKIEPDYKAGWLNLGALRADREDWDGAIGCYNRALAIDPNYVNALFNRGNAYRLKKDYDKSIADFTRVIELDSNDAVACNNRGIAREERARESGDPALAELAFKDYGRAIEIDKDYADAYVNRGSFHMDRKEWRKALTDFQKAWDLSPRYHAHLEPRIAELKRLLGE